MYKCNSYLVCPPCLLVVSFLYIFFFSSVQILVKIMPCASSSQTSGFVQWIWHEMVLIHACIILKAIGREESYPIRTGVLNRI